MHSFIELAYKLVVLSRNFEFVYILSFNQTVIKFRVCVWNNNVLVFACSGFKGL